MPEKKTDSLWDTPIGRRQGLVILPAALILASCTSQPIESTSDTRLGKLELKYPRNIFGQAAAYTGEFTLTLQDKIFANPNQFPISVRPPISNTGVLLELSVDPAPENKYGITVGFLGREPQKKQGWQFSLIKDPIRDDVNTLVAKWKNWSFYHVTWNSNVEIDRPSDT